MIQFIIINIKTNNYLFIFNYFIGDTWIVQNELNSDTFQKIYIFIIKQICVHHIKESIQILF